jgi:hypothetical protein
VAAWQRRSRQPIRRKKRRSAAEVKVRLAVFARDRVCRLKGVDGAGPCFGGPTFHHVRKEGQGGEYTEENGALLCAGHNDLIEADADVAAIARKLGLVKRRGD